MEAKVTPVSKASPIHSTHTQSSVSGYSSHWSGPRLHTVMASLAYYEPTCFQEANCICIFLFLNTETVMVVEMEDKQLLILHS